MTVSTGAIAIRTAATANASAAEIKTTRREPDTAASSGISTSQTAATEPMPPEQAAIVVATRGERRRRDEMGAFVAAGAREIAGRRDRNDRPRHEHELGDRGQPAERQEDRQEGERGETDEQPRRNEGAVARCGQRVLPRRRMHERVQIVPDRL